MCHLFFFIYFILLLFILLLFILFFTIFFIFYLFTIYLFIFIMFFCYFLKMSHFIFSHFSYLFLISYYLLFIIIYYLIIYFIFYFFYFSFFITFFYLICRFTEEIKITAESLGCQRPWLIRPGIGHLQGHWMANSCNRPSANRHLTRLLGRWKCTCSQGQTFAFRERKMLGESFQVLTLGAPGGRESCGHIPSAYQFNSFTHQHIF